LAPPTPPAKHCHHRAGIPTHPPTQVPTAWAGFKLRGEKASSIPLAKFFALSLCTFTSSFSSIYALKYVTMPVRVLFKSTKALPVMAAGLVMGKRYPPRCGTKRHQLATARMRDSESETRTAAVLVWQWWWWLCGCVF
jgi:hypothetical protein